MLMAEAEEVLALLLDQVAEAEAEVVVLVLVVEIILTFSEVRHQ